MANPGRRLDPTFATALQGYLILDHLNVAFVA